MALRWIVLLLAVGILTSCTSLQKRPKSSLLEPVDPNEKPPIPLPEANWREKYVGIKGYFTRPPMYAWAKSPAYFERCKPFVIKKVETNGASIVLDVLQGTKTIKIMGLNRKRFKGEGQRIPLLDRYFVKELDFIPQRNLAASSKLCEGQMAQKMSRKEFLFVTGDPDTVKRENTTAGPTEQWIYKGHTNYPGMTYYFLKGQLYSWTP